jgi:hypothetical protein
MLVLTASTLVVVVVVVVINEIFQKECTGVLRTTLKPELIVKNKTTANSVLAVPVLRFSFCIIHWR